MAYVYILAIVILLLVYIHLLEYVDDIHLPTVQPDRTIHVLEYIQSIFMSWTCLLRVDVPGLYSSSELVFTDRIKSKYSEILRYYLRWNSQMYLLSKNLPKSIFTNKFASTRLFLYILTIFPEDSRDNEYSLDCCGFHFRRKTGFKNKIDGAKSLNIFSKLYFSTYL